MPSPLHAFASDLMSSAPAADPPLPQTSKYPWLKDIKVQWGPPQTDDRQMEFYPPWEEDNPNPGAYTIQLYNRGLRGDALEEATAAEGLHRLGGVDPRTGQAVNPAWRSLREQFGRLFSSEQDRTNRAAYERGGETRPFEAFMDQSRLDAYLRAYFFPNANPEWRGMPWSDEQRAVLEQMRSIMDSP